MSVRLDRLVFGDNQFFGVNHMSEGKARAQAQRFDRIEAITAVLDGAVDEGIGTFACTTHDRIAAVCEHLRAQPARYAGFRVLPCMPYAHKYADAVTERGMLGAVRQFLPDGGLLDAAIKGGQALLHKDVAGVATLLVDAEMKMFEGLETPVIFLQNVLVDLLLGLGAHDGFTIFAEHVRRRYGAAPGFMTMNLPMLAPVLSRLGIDEPIVAANYNAIGFRMCGGVEAYRRVMGEHRVRLVAMSVFASGAIEPERALDWVCAEPQVESILFGASTIENIRATRQLVEARWSVAAE
jgi:hypothetical protein